MRRGAGAIGGRLLRTGRGFARRGGCFRLGLRERNRWPARRPVRTPLRGRRRCGRTGRLDCCRCRPDFGRRRDGCGRAAAVGRAVPVIGRRHRGRDRGRRRTAACGLAGPRLLGLLGRECFLEPADDRRLDRRGRRSHELAHFLELGHDGLALYAELLSELVYPDLRHCAPSTRSGLAGPVSRSGQRVLRPASASAVHRRMLIGRSSQSQPAFPGRVATAVRPHSASSPGSRCQPPPSVRRCPGAAGRACPRYSTTAPVPNVPDRRSARANARRRCAFSKHPWLGCRYAPRPGLRAGASGTISFPAATKRSKSDLTARAPQPTQVRIAGACRVCECRVPISTKLTVLPLGGTTPLQPPNKRARRRAARHAVPVRTRAA